MPIILEVLDSLKMTIMKSSVNSTLTVQNQEIIIPDTPSN